MHPHDDMPPVPLTLEGAAVLHQMLRVRWPAWRDLGSPERREILEEAAGALLNTDQNRSAMYSMLGHKGDLMLIHFRNCFDEVADLQTSLPRLRLWDFLEQTSSYVSVVELGLYETTGKVYASLAEKGVVPYTPEWNEEIGQTLGRQRQAMHPRLFPEVPPAKYLCFYPMDRKRGEKDNWYEVPMERRQVLMQEHGAIGRRYAGTVKQIISGSIGFDDWEWGVDLFAEDPLVFKRLIYEMRFDKASSAYALFGAFYVGKRMERDAFRDFLLI
ncbi:MAG TPA: hydrogen peroxide-dependent heme synthase [Bryobacteraceae bacterium]|nr:hydrogen peroxide-dependent heme synthase [Bryobacteraceae bacterium]